ncbi:MAG: RluA family pseudouridine synthase [Bacteroidales bacterium]|nr:RluA family pseudouridine synthase [Bacteroidales bacterium]MDD3860108.1 RluA family pseudouridine synthase [Bacteroidales bacterium]
MLEDAFPIDEVNEESEQSELYEHHRLVIELGQKMMRLDKYLVSRLPSTSRNRIQNASEAGNILVNGNSAKNSYKVKPGDVVSIVLSYPKSEFELVPENIPLDIVYEDDDLIIVNKKAGMVVHPAFGHFEGTLVHALAYRFQNLPMFEGKDVRPGLIHRIDKDTSGILVIAKSDIALNKLARQFFDHTCKRSYQALVWGNLSDDTGTITGNIGRSLKNRKVMDVFPEGDYGKEAITHYKVLERLGYVNLVECRLETGRTHQIRAHFKSIGHPLFNDADYGGDKILKGTTFTKYKQFVDNCFKILPRQALHAKSLGFIHPVTGKEVYFDSELPQDMHDCINKWRNYTSGREDMSD